MPGERPAYGTHFRQVSGLLIGYARVSTDVPGFTAQRDALTALSVPAERVYVDHGLTGTQSNVRGFAGVANRAARKIRLFMQWLNQGSRIAQFGRIIDGVKQTLGPPMI
jgi:Resolvase, N terminal domain